MLGCQQPADQAVTHPDDYNSYLGSAPTGPDSKYFRIWNSKIRPDSMQLTSFGVVAGEYARAFEHSGNIEYLKMAEQALRRGVEIAAIGKADFYRALARNYISQHRFREAALLADSAMAMGSGMRANHALQFDVLMELGRYDAAEKHLGEIADMARMDYLIRLAKWSDHQGDLKKAIFCLELAAGKAQRSKNPALVQWFYTNLADYYGHAGEIEKSYRHYLKALELDPSNAYAKKGLAWIVYSHERNPAEAMRILDSVTSYYRTPDIWLLKADIAGALGKHLDRAAYLDRFSQMIQNPDYGGMYNSHAIALYLETTGQVEKALTLAGEEATNRATPEVFSLLAYAYYRNGQADKALELVRDQVDGRTHEPQPLLYAAEIYKATGREGRAAELAGELEEAVYELGPETGARLRSLKM
nr:hypothetical protein [Robiginitalea sp. SC105]